METALVSLICIAALIVGVVTLTFNAFQSATTVADSLREMEQQASEIRLTEIDASLWSSLTGYTVAYAGEGDDGYLKTIEIATDGQITDTVIDMLEFDTLQGNTPGMVPISGDVYAIAYAGDGDVGILKTVEIATDGQITDIVVDTLEFDSLAGKTPHMVHVSGNVYAIAYAGNVDVGILKTVEIATDGQITDTVVDTLEFDSLKGITPHMAHISGDVYAIAYAGNVDVGILKTVEIAIDGQITDTVIDTLEFDILKGITPHMVHIAGDVYAIAYAGDGDDGFLKTVEIAADGLITDTVIDTLEFDTLQGKTPGIIRTSGDIYAVAYAGDGDVGILKTVEIATGGQITDTVVDTLEFDALQGISPDIIQTPSGISEFYLRVVNQGKTSLAQFAKWDIVVQYQGGAANYIGYTTNGSPGSNEWTVEGIYLLNNSTEVFDPDILNPEEQMKLLINIDPGIGAGEAIRITISTPHGVTSQCLVMR